MKLKELVFPVSPDAFVAYQESGVGRELSRNERELVFCWVPLFNSSFEDGQKNDASALGDSLDLLDGFIQNAAGRPALERFLKSCRRWVMYAWRQGREEAVV